MTWRDTLGRVVPFSQKKQPVNYWKYIGGFVLVLSVSGASFLGYRYYVVHREQNAQKIFAECAHEYQKALQDDTVWPDVVTLCEQGYALHSNAHLAPYFLAYQSEALIKQNKMEEAQNILDQMVKLLPKKSPLYYLYKTKLLLLMHDESMKKWFDKVGSSEIELNANEDSDFGIAWAWITALDTLGHDEQNPYRDKALYYVGLYYWSINDLENAEKAWQDLVALDTNSEAPSPWAGLVKDKLEQLQNS